MTLGYPASAQSSILSDENLEAFLVFLAMRKTFGKPMAGCQSADQPELFEHGPIVRVDQFNGFHAHFGRVDGQILTLIGLKHQ